MRPKTVTSAVIAAVLSFSLGIPAIALAGDRSHDRHGSSHSGGKHYKQDRHYKRDHKRHNKRHSTRHSKRHYGYNKHHYKGHHYPRYYGHRGYGRHYYYDDDNDELLFGLITGGILGYALNQSQRNPHYDYPPAPESYRQGSGSCLQEREYQTTVIVGGRSVDAYGTACLQPDGSWTRSPPRVANY